MKVIQRAMQALAVIVVFVMILASDTLMEAFGPSGYLGVELTGLTAAAMCVMASERM